MSASHVAWTDVKQKAFLRMYHDIELLKYYLAERERELMDLKGPCHETSCRLHRDHTGTCESKD